MPAGGSSGGLDGVQIDGSRADGGHDRASYISGP
jgi:hypothetical protein